MAVSGPSKKMLQDLIDDIGDKLQEMMDPALTREDLVALVQQLDAQVNGDDEDDDDGEDEDE